MPKVSIVIPVYNVEEYLNRCLNSVLNQSYFDWECILVDDGSTDLSRMICDNFSRKDKRFKAIHQKNQGVSKARNVGIESAKGEFLVFVDPDDFINEDYLSALIHKQRESDADIVAAKVDCILDENMYPGRSDVFKLRVENFIRQSGLLNRRIIPSHDSKSELIDRISKASFSAWAKLFKIEIFEKIRFPEGVPKGEDIFTICEALSVAETVQYADDPVYCYTSRNNGLSHSTITQDQYNMTKKSWLESCNRMIDKHPNERFKINALYAALEFLTLRPCLRKEKKHDN